MTDLTTIIEQTTVQPRQWQGTNVVNRCRFTLPNNLFQVGGLAPFFGSSDACLNDFTFCNPVFASTIETDDYYNDYTRVLVQNITSTPPTFTLQKYTGTWNNVESPIASPTGDITNPQLFFYGLVLSWREVLIAYGEGTYRINVSGITSLNYVLKEFSCDAAVGTFKVKTTNKGEYVTEQRTFNIPFTWVDEFRYVGEMRLNQASPFRNELRFSEFATNDRLVKNTQRKQYRALFHEGLLPLWERYTLYAFSGIDTRYTDYYTANQEHIIDRVLVGDSTAGYTGDINTNKAYKFEAALLSAKDMGYTNELTNDLI